MMNDIPAATDMLQVITLAGFVLATVLAIVGWRRIASPARYLAIAVLSYTIPGIVYYATIIFLEPVTTSEMRTLLSVVLRLDSLILVAAGLWLAIRSGRREGV